MTQVESRCAGYTKSNRFFFHLLLSQPRQTGNLMALCFTMVWYLLSFFLALLCTYFCDFASLLYLNHVAGKKPGTLPSASRMSSSGLHERGSLSGRHLSVPNIDQAHTLLKQSSIESADSRIYLTSSEVSNITVLIYIQTAFATDIYSDFWHK